VARILVAGLASIDLIFRVDEMPPRPEKYRANDAVLVGGGGGANAAVAIARLGGAASLVARIAADRIGTLILEDLAAEGVETALLHRSEGGRSSFSSIYIDASGSRQVMNFRGSGLANNVDWIGNDIQADAVLTDNRWPALTAKVLRIARELDVPGVVDGEDPVDIDCLQDATHIAFSTAGLFDLTGERDLPKGLRAARTKLPTRLFVTDGKKGVFFLDGKSVEHIQAPTVDVQDTLAAGDVWHGAFALRLAEGASDLDAATFANAAASLKCAHFGGRTACPVRETVEAFMHA